MHCKKLRRSSVTLLDIYIWAMLAVIILTLSALWRC
jgi:hypothetical protein